jgi:hypothetical protein
LQVCAQFGPEPLPLSLLRQPFRRHRRTRPRPFLSPREIDDAVDAVVAYSLARRAEDSLTIHRLLAAVIRAHQSPADRRTSATAVRRLLAGAATGDPAQPNSWPAWTRLIPHLLAAPALHPDDPATRLDETSRDLLRGASLFLIARGDGRAATALAQGIYDRDRRLLGHDHHDTLLSAHHLATALHEQKDYQAARTLYEDLLARRRRILGDDHPDTLGTATELAIDLRALGDAANADALEAEVRQRRQS